MPFGKYCRSSPLVFSFVPRCQGLCRELIEVARTTLAYLRDAAARLAGTSSPAVVLWQAKVRHDEPLIERVIAQSERRVLSGEAVPAGDKLVSLFEAHADIIVKGSRDVDYGHKLNLTTGKSGLILDLVIEAGNPADSERLLPMLERHITAYGAAPRQAAADGGFASRDNLSQAKACGVRDMAFHKKSGLKIEDMVRSHWVYRKLRNFRAGLEAGISCLKRAYGLARCTWRGLDHSGRDRDDGLESPLPGGFGCVKSLMSGPCTKSLLRQHFSSRGCRRHQDVPSMCSAEKESLRARFIWLDGSDGPCPCGT